MGPVRVVVGIALAGSVLTACQDPAEDGGPGARDGGPVAFHTDGAEGGDAALLRGTVEVGARCIVVVDADGTRYLPVFHRADASGDAGGLTFGGRSYADGEGIELGGGVSDDPAVSADHVPEGCEYDLGWVVAT